MGVVWTLGVRWLLSKLALPAESIDLKRTAQQCELTKIGCTFEKPIHFRHLYVIYPFAADTKDVVMRLHVAVIARNLVQESYLTRLSHCAKLLQNPVDRGQ
jgi:hypothetical protein